MSRRQEICRDFQRGSCRWGSRCKFLHSNNTQQQQQRQPNQNQKNAFGGGGNFNYYGSLANNNNSAQRPAHSAQSHLSAKDHKCNDPRVCKDQIKEDFASEHPVFWRLTCYAHYKFLPNDIVGDVSPEELRAIAYEGAKQGLSLKDVAQREASMVAAKNAEFDALLRNPYKGPASQNAAPLQPFSASPFTSSPAPQNSSTVMVFGQPLTLTNQTVGAPGFAQTSHSLGGAAAAGFNFSQPSGDVTFGTRRPATQNPSSFGVKQTSLFQHSPFTNAVAPNTLQTTSSINMEGSGAAPVSSIFQSPTMTPAVQSPFGFNSAFPGFSPNSGSAQNFATSPGNSLALAVTPVSPLMNTAAAPVPSANSSEDAKWLLSVWKIGEIPEGEPPVHLRFK